MDINAVFQGVALDNSDPQMQKVTFNGQFDEDILGIQCSRKKWIYLEHLKFINKFKKIQKMGWFTFSWS